MTGTATTLRTVLRQPPAVLLPAVLLAVLVAALSLLSLVPPVSRDALVHHLAVPKLYLLHGAMVELPAYKFSYYPMNLHLLYLAALAAGSDIAPKFIHALFGYLTAGLIAVYLKRRLNLAWGLWGALLFLSLPLIVKLSITVYVDLGLAFFSFAALLLLIRWSEEGFANRWLAAAGVCCGLALGTKYNALLVLLGGCFLVLWLYTRDGVRPWRRLAPAAVRAMFLTAVALAVFSPWMARNLVWTGNPLYPLYKRQLTLLPSRATPAEATPSAVPRLGPLSYRHLVYGEPWWQIALLPLRVFVQGRDNDFRHFDGRLNPYLLLLPLFAGYRRRTVPGDAGGPRANLVMLAFAVGILLFCVLLRSMRVRYLIPMLPPLTVLAVLGLHRIWRLAGRVTRPRRRTVFKGALLLALVTLTALNGRYLVSQFAYVRPWAYLSGTLDRDAYIGALRYEYPALQYINAHLPGDAQVLFVFLGRRGYYCDRTYRFDLPGGNDSLLHRTVRSAAAPEQVLDGLRTEGITHLLVHTDLFEQWVNDAFAPADRRRLQAFMTRYVRRLYSRNGVDVLVLATPAADGPAPAAGKEG